METFSTLLALCEGNSPVTGEFPSQRPVTWSFDVFFDLCWTNSWANHHNAGDLRCQCAHYDVTVMFQHAWLLCKCSRCIPIFSFCHMSVPTVHDVMQYSVSCHIEPCYNETHYNVTSCIDGTGRHGTHGHMKISLIYHWSLQIMQILLVLWHMLMKKSWTRKKFGCMTMFNMSKIRTKSIQSNKKPKSDYSVLSL